MRSKGLRDFAHIDLSGADFTGLDLTATVFNQANLRAARFNRAKLSGASFGDADLTATDFGGADLSGVDMASSKGWRESRCDGATVMPAGWRCDDDGRPAPLSPFAP